MDEPKIICDWVRISVLGSGSFGIVTLWRNDVNEEFIAVKKCKFNLPDRLTRRQRERWTSEVDMMKKIDHNNIVQFKPLPKVLEDELLKFNPTRLPILSMEYCRQGNLRHAFNLSQNSCGLYEPEVKYLLGDVGRALSYLHDLNITHRDIKPENIVLQKNSARSTGIIYKLIDLGYAKELDSNTVSCVGTLQYLAPEIFYAKTYTNTVDYWSFGIVAFEAVCGVRPFLPNFPPIECLKYLGKKTSADISIYVGLSGSMQFSTELRAENHVSTCLKAHIEDWLRLLLEFNPSKRGKTESSNLFAILEDILQKKIIIVFSVFTYEFYSYEVNNSTLLSTVQDWIARDTQISRNEQILIIDGKYDYNDKDLATDLFDQVHTDPIIFVFKKGTAMNQNMFPKLPKIVRLMFENHEAIYEIKAVRRYHTHSVYYISQERHLWNALRIGCQLQNVEVKILSSREKKLFKVARSNLERLLTEINCYDNIIRTFCDTYRPSDKYKDFLRSYVNYLRQTEEVVKNFNLLIERRQQLYLKSIQVEAMKEEIEKIFNDVALNTLYNDAVQCHAKYANVNKPEKPNTGCREMLKIISNIIKIRDKLFIHEFLQQYIISATKVQRELQKIFLWLSALNVHIKKNSEEFSYKEFGSINNQTDLNCNGVGTTRLFDSTMCYETSLLREENYSLRYNFQEIMDKCLLNHKNILRELNNNDNHVITNPYFPFEMINHNK